MTSGPEQTPIRKSGPGPWPPAPVERPQTAGQQPVRGVSLWQDGWRRLRKNKVAVIGGVVLAMIVLLSLIGPWLVLQYNGFSFETQDLGSRLANPSRDHLLGTDTLGRDLLARVLYGTRISLMVGLVSTLISLLIGVAYGSVAGYFGGRLDEIMMRSADVLYSLPDMLLIVVLLALFDRSLLLSAWSRGSRWRVLCVGRF
jgi:oligopeptide transport system permease protein